MAPKRSPDGGPPPHVGRVAIVIGASMAGLCAARVLSERFGRVIVVDRDSLPHGPVARRHVPQGRHPHLLMPAGARLLASWFPGFVDELEQHGAISVDLCHDFYWHQAGGPQRRPSSTLRAPAMSRPLLECTVRRRVEALSNVTVRDGVAVDAVRCDPSRQRLTGVRLADGEPMACDLVVDASGRHARSLRWLEELGYEGPPTTVVGIDTRYVTRVYRRGGAPAHDWLAAAVIGDPSTRRLAMALPMEGDRWIVALGGLNGESAPLDDAEALTYARTFESPVVAHLMQTSQQIGEPVVHRFVSNQRRHVERLHRFPLGWVLLGDAVCSFDPIYGQGMTSAALQADALGRCLDRRRAIDRRFARRYFKAAGRSVKAPWSIAVGGDFAYEGTTGKKPFGTDLLNRYMNRVVVAGQRDDGVVIRFNEVVSLVRGPESLLAPRFVLRVLRHTRPSSTRRSGSCSTEPTP
jgi:2-polyprenyl-6-methoxyphenol hydroxylase-like FAD-dependent oxidoreductase